MATFTWEGFFGAGPAWADIAANTVVFSGSATDLSEPVTVASWQDGTHIGDGDPGADQCGANHNNNVKYISSTQFDSGGGTETLNDTNLTADECTLRVRFTDAASVAITNARFYIFNSTTTTTRATGIDAAAFEQGQAATTWTVVNDDSVAGALTVGGTGGDNSGHRLDLADQGAATDHTYYIAISMSPESVGAKTALDMGVALTYS